MGPNPAQWGDAAQGSDDGDSIISERVDGAGANAFPEVLAIEEEKARLRRRKR